MKRLWGFVPIRADHRGTVADLGNNEEALPNVGKRFSVCDDSHLTSLQVNFTERSLELPDACRHILALFIAEGLARWKL